MSTYYFELSCESEGEGGKKCHVENLESGYGRASQGRTMILLLLPKVRAKTFRPKAEFANTLLFV
jgi:hypothetical protein